MCTGAQRGSSISFAQCELNHGISRWCESVMCGMMMSVFPASPLLPSASRLVLAACSTRCVVCSSPWPAGAVA
jgi:hypothetical protein